MSHRPVRLVVGCGYLGHRVARHWVSAGDEVWALTRSAGRAEAFREEGLQSRVADVLEPASLAGLPAADVVLVALGYDRTTGRSIEETYVGGLTNLLAALPPTTGRVIYISSTGVYGQTEGEWIDEEAPCQPITPGGRACLAAETLLASHPLGERSIRLRLAGIYGPGRIPRREALAAGEPIAVASDSYLNLIHVDDAARIVVACEQLPVPPARLYNVTDGAPVERGDYYAELARLLGAPAPRFALPDASTGSRGRTDKRVSAARLARELKIDLNYPDYRAGLAAIVQGEKSDR